MKMRGIHLFELQEGGGKGRGVGKGRGSGANSSSSSCAASISSSCRKRGGGEGRFGKKGNQFVQLLKLQEGRWGGRVATGFGSLSGGDPTTSN